MLQLMECVILCYILGVEELKKEIELSEEDDKNNRYCTTAQLRRKHPFHRNSKDRK